MRTIAVISDTHDHLPESVVDTIARADEIWHLGDVCRPDTIDPLLALGRPFSLVRGNCDSHWDWRLRLRVERHDVIFHLEHIPMQRPPAGVHVVLHGHTHVPRDEMVLGTRFLNPGCISRPNRGAPASFGWLRIADNGTLDWTIERLR